MLACKDEPMKHVARSAWTGALVLQLAWPVLAQDTPAPAAAPVAAEAAATGKSKPARKAANASAGCYVAEFRTLGLDSHVPAERAALATQWLLKQGPACSEEQILMIRANRALWLGTGDTPAIMGLVDRLVEARQSGRPDALQSMYAPPQPDRAGVIDVQRVNGGMRPVVPAPAAAPMVLGAQVQVPPMPPAANPSGGGGLPAPPGVLR